MARVRYFIENPQTTIALTFLTYIISAIGGVYYSMQIKGQLISKGLLGILYSSFSTNFTICSQLCNDIYIFFLGTLKDLETLSLFVLRWTILGCSNSNDHEDRNIVETLKEISGGNSRTTPSK